MSISVQLSFNFPRSQPDRAGTSGVPIDQTFPQEAANELARLESFNKHLYRPNTYLHKWWARRSGTTFRHILKQLVDDPFKRDFYEPGGLEGRVILDPMMGGGTTLHEAIRMGANVVGVDIDPIPVVQAKATLSLLPLAHKKARFQSFFRALSEQLAPLYRTTCPTCDAEAETRFLLYGLRRRCACREVLFLDSLLLRENHGDDIYICPRCHAVYAGPDHRCQTRSDRPLLEKGTNHCEKCLAAFEDLLDIPFSQRYVPLVVVGVCPEHGQFFKAMAPTDQVLLAEAEMLTQQVKLGNPSDFSIPDGPKSKDLLSRNITSFQALFTPRQLLYLGAAHDLLAELPDQDRLWLALLVSTSLEFNALLCGYKGSGIRRPGAIRHVFSHHAYSFPYTALENNPVFSDKASGTLKRLFHDRILRAGQWAIKPMERLVQDNHRTKVPIRGEIDGGQPITEWAALGEGQSQFLLLQADSAALDVPLQSVDFVVTDPPYYDSVQYSDLSNFFRVWLRLFLPHEANWQYDPLASAVSEGDASGGFKYGEVLGEIWQTCHRALKIDHGRLVFTFHHWNHKAWAELTLSLKAAGFVLVNRYVMFSENPTSVHIQGLKALKHDTVLVLKPETGDDTPHQWEKPDQVDATDSYNFCRDCGTVLGWCLKTDIDARQIRHTWQQLLEGNNNDHDQAPS